MVILSGSFGLQRKIPVDFFTIPACVVGPVRVAGQTHVFLLRFQATVVSGTGP